MLYQDYINAKRRRAVAVGFDAGTVHPSLFPHQDAIVRWATRQGRAAIFADTGLGKTRMQLAWLRLVLDHEGGRGLILAPLAVADQTMQEAADMGIRVEDIDITNYHRLHQLDPAAYTAVVLDESSILKSYDGSTRTALIQAFADTPYRLACTATPSPNDHTELGNHAEFLGTCTRQEMLAEFFVHDGASSTARGWRLKGHARREFWRWVASWSVVVRTPEDLGMDGSRYVLPELRTHRHVVDVPHHMVQESGMLLAVAAQTLADQRRIRKATIEERSKMAADVATASDGPCIIWCELNEESLRVAAELGDLCVEVTGSDDAETKRDALLRFSRGEVLYIVTKPTIAGFGMNWQHCSRMVFVGLTHSFEQYYQAVRRCWRFGQRRRVDVHVVQSSADGAIVGSIAEKSARFEELGREVVSMVRDEQLANLAGSRPGTFHRAGRDVTVPRWLSTREQDDAVY
jgi:superfamily II DNA or RNA helicase